MTIKTLLKTYLSLTKPGVLFGNALSVGAGFLLASRGHINIPLFNYTFLGMLFVIASACTLNNYFDRDIDSIMTRTKNRAVAAGIIPGRNAVIFGIILGLIGFFLLGETNLLVLILAAIGFVDYLVLYAMIGKRKSMHGTLIGSISGAIPILTGYTAVTGTIDAGGILAFLVIFLWQQPEFYSIAIYRHDEYKKANVPVISVVKGITHTRFQILIYTILFVIASLLLFTFGYTGLVYFVIMSILNLIWVIIGVRGFYAENLAKWAREMFHFSLIILLTFCFLISLTGLVP